MALVKCKECGHQISDKAEQCPHCGIKIKGNEKKGCGTFLIYGILSLIIFSSGMSIYESFNPKPIQTVEVIRKNELDRHFDLNGSHIGLTHAIRKILNDPASYVHEKTIFEDRGDHLLVETTFRAKNSFGGFVTHKLQANTDLNGNVLGIISHVELNKI